ADIAQSAWLKGWEHLNQLRDDRMVVTWVNSIALNQFRRWIRYDRFSEILRDPVDSRMSVNWAAIDIARILRSCRVPDRHLLEAQMEGSTAKEIAQEMGASQTAIRIRLLRARRAARQSILPRRKSQASKAATQGSRQVSQGMTGQYLRRCVLQ